MKNVKKNVKKQNVWSTGGKVGVQERVEDSTDVLGPIPGPGPGPGLTLIASRHL